MSPLPPSCATPNRSAYNTMIDPHPDFTKALHTTYQMAVDEAKYRAPYFHQMLVERYGFDTACHLIMSKDATTGFTRMFEVNRLDLTVEAVVLNPKWFRLFEKEILQTAYDRLKDFGYIFPVDAWNPKIESPAPETPRALDIAEPETVRIFQQSYRILRDTEVSRKAKMLNNYKCQICGHRIELPDGQPYVEAHHIKPLGRPHDGPDILENVICVCPNHHTELDYGVIPIFPRLFKGSSSHYIEQKFVDYHNTKIHKGRTRR